MNVMTMILGLFNDCSSCICYIVSKGKGRKTHSRKLEINIILH